MEGTEEPARIRHRWTEEGSGVALSLLLHGLLLLAALWYLAHRPVLKPADLRALPVEIVLGEAPTEGPSTKAAAPRRQVAPPHQQSAPVPEGVSPKGTREPEDELSAKLRALAHLQQPEAALPNADNSTAAGGNGSGAGSYSLKDFIRAQILRRWLPDLSVPGARDMPVLVRIRLLASGVIDDVTIIDQARMHTDKPFRDMALSARDAALLASPIALPPGRYTRAQDIMIDLDPKSVLR